MKPFFKSLFYKTLNLQQLIVAAVSGIIMGLSPEPLNWWVLSWIALFPLWLLVSKAQVRKAAILSFVWGFCFHATALFWITGVHPMTWMGVPWLASLAIAIAVWLVIGCWGGLFVLCWGLGLAFCSHRLKITGFTRLLFAVALWCCLESIWSYSPLWWSSLSLTQSPHNLVILQLAQLSGFNTVTAAIVAVNGAIAEGITEYIPSSDRYRKLAVPLILFVAFHGVGWLLYQVPVAADNLDPIRVGIIQGNIPNEIKLYSQGWAKAIDGYTTGYQSLAPKVDVVLTPETALPFYWEDIIDNGTFYKAVKENKVPAWVGAYGSENKSYTNSLFTLTAEGATYSRYDKTILVPLGEYIPFEPIIGKIIDRLSPLEAHLQRGQWGQIFDTPFGRAVVGICYESAYARHFRRQTAAGGEFMLTASNNAHYSDTMPAQHHAQDVIRAIESDRWMARATNTGYSAIVDPRGRSIWRSQINQYQTYADRIYKRHTITPFVRWGDWLTVALLIICGGLLSARTLKIF